MNMIQAEATKFVEDLLLEIGDMTEVEVVIIPPFTAIAEVIGSLEKAQNIKVGAQNMHWEHTGAFTGEISASMLRDLFVRYVVLGHSERRQIFGETDEIVNRKVQAALKQRCDRLFVSAKPSNNAKKGVWRKFSHCNSEVASPEAKAMQETVIAYEPVWAIGPAERQHHNRRRKRMHLFVKR